MHNIAPGKPSENRSSTLTKYFIAPFSKDAVVNIAICFSLTLIVWLAFGRALGNDFVNYDDTDYVYENPHITSGLSLSGVGWAFTHVHAANWHPLTTISHMLDCQIYGLRPWGHHLTNIILHAAVAILLFLALQKLMAGDGSSGTVAALYERRPEERKSAPSAVIDRRYNFWASAFVAALFAVHPLRVESVAWVSERKDVLSGVFFMLTLLAYARYVHGVGKDSHSLRRYLAVVIFFALGLMSKPTLVTLPFVLLLLDYWPLGRIGGRTDHKSQATGQFGAGWAALFIEKIPLFVLAAFSCVATVLAQQNVIEANLRMSFLERANNAFVSYVAYLGEMIWPAHLVVSHPYSEKYANLPEAIAALVFLVGISVLCLLFRKKYPFLPTGWFWYIGVLVPMIGLVQVSAQARADRYTYLSQIGIYLIIAWGAAALVNRFRVRRVIVAAPVAVVMIILICCSYAQARYWRNTEALWRHALDSSTYDFIAHDSLGYALLEQGKTEDAIAEYKKALEIKPDYAESHNNLGNVMMLEGRLIEATVEYRKAIELNPDAPEMRNNLGNALFKAGQVDEAIQLYREAVAKEPRSAEIQCNLGSAYIVKGDWANAIDHLQTALKIDSKYPEAHNKLGIALGASGKTNEAIKEFRDALRLNESYAQAHFNLGLVLAYYGQRQEGIAHLREAVRLKPDYTDAKEQLTALGVPASP